VYYSWQVHSHACTIWQNRLLLLSYILMGQQNGSLLATQYGLDLVQEMAV
jgi:hypothetical protein